MNYFQVITTFIITAIVAFALHTLDVGAIKLRDQSAMQQQAADLQKICKDDKLVTQEVSHDYQDSLIHLSAEFDGLQQPPPSSVSIAIPTTGHDGAASKSGHVAKNATSDQLYKFAAEAEKYRLQLKSCQSFVTQTWALEKQ